MIVSGTAGTGKSFLISAIAALLGESCLLADWLHGVIHYGHSMIGRVIRGMDQNSFSLHVRQQYLTW